MILDLILLDESGNEVKRTVLEVFPGQQVARFVDDAGLMESYFGTVEEQFRGTLKVFARDASRISLIGLLQDRTTGAQMAVGSSNEALNPEGGT